MSQEWTHDMCDVIMKLNASVMIEMIPIHHLHYDIQHLPMTIHYHTSCNIMSSIEVYV
jgi:hypothetical protein